MKKKQRVFTLFLLCVLLITVCPFSTLAGSFNQPLSSESAIVIDAETGNTLYEKNADAMRYPASTTKLVTALLLVREGDLEDQVTVSESSAEDLDPDSSSVTPALQTGEILTVEELLWCILISSDNRACNVAAEYLCGDVASFVEKMNALAAELGCTGTHFANAHGLHDEEHYTTASDMAKIARQVWENNWLMSICETTEKTLPATNMTEERTLRTTNYLQNRNRTEYYYSLARGMKTGHTTPAGYCLVTGAEKDGLEIITVVLNAKVDEETGEIGSFTDAKALLSWALDAYEMRTLVRKGEVVAEVSVGLSSERDYVMAETGAELEVLVESDLDEELLEREVLLDSPEGIDAPVEKGQRLGEMTIRYQDQVLGTVELVAATSVSFSGGMLFQRQLGAFFSSPIFWIILVLLLCIGTIYVMRVVRLNRERRRNRR